MIICRWFDVFKWIILFTTLMILRNKMASNFFSWGTQLVSFKSESQFDEQHTHTLTKPKLKRRKPALFKRTEKQILISHSQYHFSLFLTRQASPLVLGRSANPRAHRNLWTNQQSIHWSVCPCCWTATRSVPSPPHLYPRVRTGKISYTIHHWS